MLKGLNEILMLKLTIENLLFALYWWIVTKFILSYNINTNILLYKSVYRVWIFSIFQNILLVLAYRENISSNN